MAWKGRWAGGRIHVDSRGQKSYYIRRRILGHLYEVNTRATTPEAARAQLRRFEANPAAYAPAPDQESFLRLTDELRDEYVAWSEGENNVRETIARKRRDLNWWKRQAGARDLRFLDLRFVQESLDGATGGAMKLASLKGFYGWLVMVKRALPPEQDPTRTIKVPRSKPAQNRKSKVVTEEQFRKTVEKIGARWEPLLEVLWATGWHLSELARFIESGTIVAFEEDRPDGARFKLVVPRHKHGGIHQSAVGSLVAAFANQAKKLGPFDRNSLHKVVKQAAKDAGVDHWNASWLRHSLATRAVQAGAPVESVADYLGHRDRATTMRFYATHGVVPRPKGV